MIIQLSPDRGRRTYDHERVYIVANKKALERYDRLSKLSKCVQRIYDAKLVRIRAIVKRRVNKKNKSPSQKENENEKEKGKGPEKLPEPADDEDDGHTLLDFRQTPTPEDIDPETASSPPSSPSLAFFKTMKRRNIRTCINHLHVLEQREEFSRPMSYLYHVS